MTIRAGALTGGTISIAAESSHGSYDATDYREIDVSGLTPWYPISVDRANLGGITSGPRMRQYDPQRATARGGVEAAEVLAVVDGSNVTKEQVSGEFTLTVPGAWLGGTLPTASALDILLASGMQRVIRAAGANATVTGAPTANTFTVGAGEAGEFTAGDMIAVDLLGVRRFHRITRVNGTTMTTATPHGLTGGGAETVAHCHLYFPTLTGAPSGPSFALIAQDAGGTYEVTLTGCRVVGIGFRPVGDDGKVYDIELRCVAADGYHTVGSVSGYATLTEPLPWGVANTYGAKLLDAPVVISSDMTGVSAPYIGTATDLATRSWSLDVAIALDRRGGGAAYRNGMADADVGSTTVTASSVIDLVSDALSPRTWFRKKQIRSLTVTLGGYVAAGSCGCLHIPRADLASDPGLGWSDERKSFDCSFRAGAYAGDYGTSTNQTNANFVFALVA